MLDGSSKNLKRIVGAAATVACMVILSLAWISRVTQKQVVIAADQVSQSQSVMRTIEHLRAELAVAETAERDFLLTGNDEFLPAYRGALARVGETIKALRARTSESGPQRENLREVEVRVEERIAKLSNTVPAGEGSGKPSVVALLTSLRSKRTTEAMTGALGKMILEEEKTLVARQQNLERQFAKSEKTLDWLLGTMGAFAIVLLYLKLRVRKSRTLAAICAAPKTIQFEGQWISFEVYLSRRFGIDLSKGISAATIDKLAQATRMVPAPSTRVVAPTARATEPVANSHA